MAALYRLLASKLPISFEQVIQLTQCRQVTKCFSSTKTSSLNDNKSIVVLSENGRMVVCWHPEQKFLYEHSKPMPYLKPELAEEDSVLKIQHRMDNLKRFKKGGPTDKELSEMTYTYKSQWYPLARRFKRPKFPMPRPRQGV